MRATTPDSALLAVGQTWRIGVASDAAVTVVVTLPDDTSASPTAERTHDLSWLAEYTVLSTGRYVARVSTAGDAVDFAVYVAGVTTAAGMPTAGDVANYMRENAASWETEDLQDALDAEAAAQRAVCRVPAVYPADLRQALLRRVQRNLAMRGLPLAVPTGDADSGPAILPGRDPEVRRFEAPHRKLVFG